MLKSVYELLTQLFTFAHRLNRQDVVVEKLQQESKANSELNNRLVFEHVRINDEFKRLGEREAEARKLFQVQVENHLLRAAHTLPPAALPPQPTEPLQTQIDALAAALQQAQEQRLRDQTEIAQLKAQMTELSANPPKQDS